MATCTFCGYDIIPTTGKLFMRKDGKVINFCSKKCEIAMNKHNKIPRDTPWTKAYRDNKSARIAENKVAENKNKGKGEDERKKPSNRKA